MAILNLKSRLGSKLTAGQRAHYWFEAGGKKFAYCYIRKNGCSAFKKLITETSPDQSFDDFAGTRLAFLNAFHKIDDYKSLDSCDHKIFVYRDPYARLVSAYANKFVARIGNRDIFRNFKKVSGSEPEIATFRTFVYKYCKDFANKDPHIRPQLLHCLPVKYDLAIKLDNLHTDIRLHVGPELADLYFSKKKNETVYGDNFENVVDWTSEELHQNFLKSNLVPNKEAFFNEELLGIVRERYRRDYDIILEIEHPHTKGIFAGIRALGRAMQKKPEEAQ